MKNRGVETEGEGWDWTFGSPLGFGVAVLLFWLCRRECCCLLLCEPSQLLSFRVGQLMPSVVRKRSSCHISPIVSLPTLRQIHMPEENTTRQNIFRCQSSVRHFALHCRTRTFSLLLSPTIHVVPPDRKDGQTIRTGLPPFGPGQSLTNVIGVAVAEKPIKQVYLPQ